MNITFSKIIFAKECGEKGTETGEKGTESGEKGTESGAHLESELRI